MPKLQPAVMTLNFQLNTGDAGVYVNDTIDLSQCASLMNRRFYRQGKNWAVAGFTVLTQGVGEIAVMSIPKTWAAANAWVKSFHAWKDQQDNAVEEAGAESAVARYRDFKIHADTIHATAGFAGNLIPVDVVGNAYLEGEWEASTIVIPNFGAAGVNYEPFLNMVGDDIGGAGGSKGMIKGYENSRAYPHSPDPVSPDIGSNENWLQSMFDVGDNFEDVLDNATDRNDNLPYDQDNYPGGDTNGPYLEIVDEAYVTTTTVGGRSTLRGGTFYCGLVRVRNVATGVPWTSTPRLLVHLVPGADRGYMLQDMAEV